MWTASTRQTCAPASPATTFNTDFIEEVQVKSSGHAAEFGGATGGVISVISRSGTNNFSGSVGTYFNNDGLNGKLALNNSAGSGGAALLPLCRWPAAHAVSSACC